MDIHFRKRLGHPAETKILLLVLDGVGGLGGGWRILPSFGKKK